MSNADRLFKVKINDKYVKSFDVYYENNDGKLRIEYAETEYEVMYMNWFDLHFLIMNYTHSDNWETATFTIEKEEA